MHSNTERRLRRDAHVKVEQASLKWRLGIYTSELSRRGHVGPLRKRDRGPRVEKHNDGNEDGNPHENAALSVLLHPLLRFSPPMNRQAPRSVGASTGILLRTRGASWLRLGRRKLDDPQPSLGFRGLSRRRLRSFASTHELERAASFPGQQRATASRSVFQRGDGAGSTSGFG